MRQRNMLCRSIEVDKQNDLPAIAAPA
jgi:hypothetical protein